MEPVDPRQQACGVQPQSAPGDGLQGVHQGRPEAQAQVVKQGAERTPPNAPCAQDTPPSAPCSQGVAQGAQPQKCFVHHSYIWLGSIRTVFAVMVAIAFASISSIASLFAEGDLFSGDAFIGMIIIGAVAGLFVLFMVAVAIYQLISYKHLYFTLDDKEFSLHKGIISKKRVHVPYQRVQSVDQRASLLQRVFGVCTVSIDTAGGSNNKAILVPYLTKQQAEWLRTELFARKRFAMVASGTVPGAISGVAVPGAVVPGTAVPGAAVPGAFPGVPVSDAFAASAFASGGNASQGTNVSHETFVCEQGLSNAAPGATIPGAAAPGSIPSAPAPGAIPSAPAPGAIPSASAPGASVAYASAASAHGGNVLDAGAAVWQDVGGLFAGEAFDTGRVSYEYGLTNKELLLAGLSNNTAFMLVVLGVLGALAQVAELAFDLFPRAGDSLATQVAAQVTGAAAASFITTAAVAMLACAAVLWLVSGVGSCISYGGFRARRRNSRIEVEHGLLQHTFQGVDIDRVQAVVIKQTFIRRLMGYCELSLSRIDAASEGDSSQQQKALNARGVVVHPFVKLGCVPEILSGIIPEYADLPREMRPVAPVALRRALIRRCVLQGSGFWLAVCVGIIQVLVNQVVGPSGIADAFEVSLQGGELALDYVNGGAVIFYIIAAVLVILDAVGAVLWFRESSFAYNARFMQISIGGFSRETMSFPRQKIQFGFTRTNPFQRRARTATLNVRTAAGVGGTTVSLVDVSEQDAHAWLGWVKPRGNITQP